MISQAKIEELIAEAWHNGKDYCDCGALRREGFFDTARDLVAAVLAESQAPAKAHSKFPTLQQVENADPYQLGRWHRFLPSAETDADRAIQTRIGQRFNKLGGFTPEISKAIGWDKP